MPSDWIAALEAAYAPADDDRVWARRVIAAVSSLLPDSGAWGINLVRHSADCSRAHTHLIVSDNPTFHEHHDRLVATASVESIRSLFYPSAVVTTMSAIARHMPAAERAGLDAYLRRYGARDSLGLVLHPEPGLAGVVFAGFDRKCRISAHQRKVFTQLALHFETGCRLRLRPESLRAVLSTEGKVEHLAAGVPNAEALRGRVKDIEKARRMRHRKDPYALDLWEALIDGTASIVERFEGSARFYFVIDNAPATQPVRAFTQKEIDVLSYSTRGLSAKLVGYSLGLSASEVSSCLARATRKVGLSSRVDLVRLAAILTRDPRARLEEVALTQAEREVLALLVRGLANQEIATMRGRSVRTIANQVASLLRKTQASGRRALATRAVVANVRRANK